MLTFIKPFVFATLGSVLSMAAINASSQEGIPATAASPAPAATAQNSAPAAGEPAPAPELAPDDVTRKISELVHAGKYAEARQLTLGLLAVYPGDQRLVKTKELLDKLIASGGAAAGQNTQPASTPQPPALNGMDKVEFNSLIELARQAQASKDLNEQTHLMEDFLVKSVPFVRAHPEQLTIWQLRAAVAIILNQPAAGNQAGKKMLDLGAADHGDAAAQEVLAKLKLMGWLDDDKVPALQQAADADRAKKQEQAERTKYTFGVAHVNGLHYEYGHITLNADSLDYTGTDGKEHLLRSNVKEIKPTANADSWGLWFLTEKGRNFYFLPITEQGVADQTGKGKIFLPIGPMWHGIMTRWGFVVEGNNKRLVPGPRGTDAQTKGVVAAPAGAVAEPELLIEQSAPEASGAKPDSAHAKVAAAVSANGIAATSGAGVAVLHACRPHRIVGRVLTPDLLVDGGVISPLKNGHVVRVNVSAGTHSLSAAGDHVDARSPINGLAMTAGNEYWVRLDLQTGAWAGMHSTLALMTPDEAAKDCAKLKEDVVQDERSEASMKRGK